MSEWYLVCRKERQEESAAGGLDEQGYAVYFPRPNTRRRPSQGMVNVVQALFLRYLFISLTHRPVDFTLTI